MLSEKKKKHYGKLPNEYSFTDQIDVHPYRGLVCVRENILVNGRHKHNRRTGIYISSIYISER